MLKFKHYTRWIAYGLGFYLYSNLKDLYLFLPPMIGFLFAFYRMLSAQEDQQNGWMLYIFFCLLCIEAIHLEPLGVLILLFILYDKIVVHWLLNMFADNPLGDALHIFAIYAIYFVILSFLNQNSVEMLRYLVGYSLFEFVLWRVYVKSQV
ncbi:hypothetical protein FNE76_00585 [Helicobacter mehlei]|uniref:Uncharacterized protein n=1 Tax=Helicobacter mehlei TaxID=2316080 RepID=A0A553V4E5_9HELI|nr:hypothetical protein FNE76_00585 [Helicobacter mehlei]